MTLINRISLKMLQFQQTVATERIIQRALAQVIFSGREEGKPLDMFLSILSEQNAHADFKPMVNAADSIEFVEDNKNIYIP